MTSAKNNTSGPVPQRQEMFVDNNSSDLVPQGKKASYYDNSDPVLARHNFFPQADKTDLSQQEMEFLFNPLFEEYYNPTHGLAEENNNDHASNASSQQDKFINPFYHPLESVIGNPSNPVQIRQQLATDPEMCMFALTVSIVEPKKIKEAMADFAWIEAMQDELYQFDRLHVWELVDKPFGKMVIKLKWSDFCCPCCTQVFSNLPYERENGISKWSTEEVYVAQPEGFVDPAHPEKVYLLKKALY
ncbi:retrovirus-related pol polyprotein from transposon TNT 1-94, partial [Tanacetum coccineum]